ncbi:MAG: phenylalanine--tRNA ligase subunit beta [Myxococcales bacterium]|nr:phenylalanine--tRNA ligase subunit beta [Myxococcales bacterium]
MPTITIDPNDFAELLGQRLDEAELERQLDLVKGEFKGRDEAGNFRVELNDTNRPDLWSAEGIARQLRAARGRRRDYSFFQGSPVGEIRVESALADIRPFVGAFAARGLRVTEKSLIGLIQTQEKLAENFGRARRDVAIGVYNLGRITFPVHYRAVRPVEHRYTPLGCDEPMSLEAILQRHPKGVQYGGILAGRERVPLLVDAAGLTLSMPPIINSRELGEVVPGDANLFVEATATNLFSLVLALNILACDLADRGARIERIRTVYPYDTPLGREVDLPRQLDRAIQIPLAEFSRLLGVPVQGVEADRVLEHYGCEVSFDGERLLVQPPPTRADYLHPVDVVEDFAIARGYETFEPRLPRDFTIGRLDVRSAYEDAVRRIMVGLGFEELFSNILTSRSSLADALRCPEQPLVEVANVMNENYAALRHLILPCLLAAEGQSATAAYPHRLFETGEVAVFDDAAPHGSRTEVHLCALLAHPQATLSELHADLEFLAQELGREFELVETMRPELIGGRAAAVRLSGREVGFFGEVHPEVLERFAIGVPAVAFELFLDRMM